MAVFKTGDSDACYNLGSWEANGKLDLGQPGLHNKRRSQAWWHTTVFPAKETETGRPQVQGQPRQLCNPNPKPKILKGEGWSSLRTLAWRVPMF